MGGFGPCANIGMSINNGTSIPAAALRTKRKTVAFVICVFPELGNVIEKSNTRGNRSW